MTWTTEWKPTKELTDLMSKYSPSGFPTLPEPDKNFPKPNQPSGRLDAKSYKNALAYVSRSENLNSSIDNILNKIRQQLKRAKIIQLFGNTLSAILGTGVITAIFLEVYQAAVITAMISLAVSCILLLSQYLVSPLYEGGKSLSDLFAELKNLSIELVHIQHQVKDDDQVIDAANKLDNVAARLVSIEKRLKLIKIDIGER